MINISSFVGLVCLVAMTTCREYVFLSTPLGGLRGVKEQVGTQEIHKFLNIPFAKPPIGDLRFKDPVAHGSWEGTRAAYKYGHICPQSIVEEYLNRFWKKLYKMVPSRSEDCLSLNIFVPNGIQVEQKKAVMVFIHGGGFYLGEGASYDPTELALTGDVIVVTIQYRVGVLGFFSTGDSSSPGNYGLKDQQLAFKWIHDYISVFGGDHDLVTIFGQSAGSMAVAHQTLNPENSGLFRRAIMESGTNGAINAVCENLRNTSAMFGIHVGCLDDTVTEETVNTQQLMQCLRGVPADNILEVQNTLMMIVFSQSASNCFTGPVIDGHFYKRHPLEILKDHNSREMTFFKSLDIIVGTTDLEGAIFSSMIQEMEGYMNYSALEGLPEDAMTELTKTFSTMLFTEQTASQIIIENLKNENKIKQGINFLQFVTDAMFTVPSMVVLLSHAKKDNGGNTYQYLFTFEFEQELFQEFLPWVKGQGSSHGSELVCLFGPGGFVEIFDDIPEEDKKYCSNLLMTYWTNFAKTGDPNSPGVPSWPLFRTSNQQYLNIGRSVTVGDHIFQHRLKFLMETVPSLLQKQKKEEL